MAVLPPKCIGDVKGISSELAQITGGFWKHVWNNPNNTIPKKYKYLMAFTAAMSSNREEQAVRELVKAFGEGATLEEIREVLEMMVWNMGVPYFSCDFNTSPIMEVYNKIKIDTEQQIPTAETVAYLKSHVVHKVK